MPDLRHWASVRATELAVVSPSGDRTFAELDANANRLARALASRGLVAGDAVALIAPNGPTFVETVAACERGGFRLTPVNWHLTAEEAGYIVDNCEAKALITAGPLLDLAHEAFERAPGCCVGLAAGSPASPFECYEAALAGEDPDPVDTPIVGGTMLYTSGTTGRPKGVYRPPADAAPASASDEPPPPSPLDVLFDYSPEGSDVHLCTGPLYHAAPLALSLGVPLGWGATIVLMERWDAAEALRLIEEHRVTHTHMVPTMFHRLLALPADVRRAADLSSLRNVLHGAAPCPVAVKQRMIDWFGPIIIEYYAATEGTASIVDSATWLEHPGTVGKPLVPGQVMIGDDDGTPLAAGEIGLVYMHAPRHGRFAYFKDRDKTEASFRGDYFTLGDIGYLDDDGYLYLTDRTANLVISGGVNIYPAEVDAVLLEHPAVGDVAVIGIPDEEWGESVLAVVEVRPSHLASEALAEELLAHCRERLAGFKCPRRVDFIDHLPREDNGKIYKRRLRDAYRVQAEEAVRQASGSGSR